MTQSQTQLAMSQYHYHHHQGWKHLREAQYHLEIARLGALQENQEIPEWLLRFQKELVLALEEVPELSREVD